MRCLFAHSVSCRVVLLVLRARRFKHALTKAAHPLFNGEDYENSWIKGARRTATVRSVRRLEYPGFSAPTVPGHSGPRRRNQTAIRSAQSANRLRAKRWLSSSIGRQRSKSDAGSSIRSMTQLRISADCSLQINRNAGEGSFGYLSRSRGKSSGKALAPVANPRGR